MLQRVWLGVNMNIEEKIKRINELYHKSQAEGLTEEERAEQAALRAEYVANVRANLRGQLDNISIKEKMAVSQTSVNSAQDGQMNAG